jgi:hypothetical protein
MQAPDVQRSKFITIFGTALTGLGVLEVFMLDRSGSGQDFLYHLLEYSWFPTLGIGLATIFLGMIAWGRYFQRRQRYQLAGVFFVGGLLFLAMPINMHDWTVALVFVMLDLWAVTFAMLWMAEDR